MGFPESLFHTNRGSFKKQEAKLKWHEEKLTAHCDTVCYFDDCVINMSKSVSAVKTVGDNSLKSE